MPPESQVELQFYDGTKKVVTGENARNLLKANPNTKMTGQKSGMYLKIGMGTHALLNRRANSKIPGLLDDDPTDRLGIVYQNPTIRQYEGTAKSIRIGGSAKVNAGYSAKLRDSIFSTRNIKLRSNDLLVDAKTAQYARVHIIPPPSGTPLKKDKLSTPHSETERDRLEKTIFRVNGKDFTATELMKNYMIPMNVPQENKPEEVQTTKGTARFIGMKPISTDTTKQDNSTYQNFLFNNINRNKSKKKALR